VMRTQEEMAQIEYAMKTLHRIFIDMQIMVEAQSETVDVVAENVEAAHSNMEKGGKASRAARQNQKSCTVC